MILEEVFIIIFFELKATTAHLEPLRMTSTHVYQGRTVTKPTCHQLTSVTPVQRANIVNGEQVSEGNNVNGAYIGEGNNVNGAHRGWQ